MKPQCLRSFLTLLFLSSAASAQTLPPITPGPTVTAPTTLPEPPAIWREVTGVKYLFPLQTTDALRQAVHTRSHVPTFHTTRDGRIGIDFKTAKITLLRPEQLGSYVRQIVNTDLTNNSYVMTNKQRRPFRIGETATTAMGSNAVEVQRDADHKSNLFSLPTGWVGSLRHVTLFDPTSANPQAGEITNPQNSNGNDVYDLNIIGVFEHGATDPNSADKIRFFVTRVQVTVQNPKTANAQIVSFVRIGLPVYGPAYPYIAAQGLEPNVVAGGKLIVLRIGGGKTAWVNPNSGNATANTDYNIVYSYNNGTASWPLNPNGWTLVHPISHAPYDTNINTTLGFALRPFRDASGQVIPDGVEFGPTYPWIDPEAKNLFFTATGDILRYQRSIPYANNSRYTNTPTVAGQPEPTSAEDFGPTRGVSFVGLWSHGKIVTIDTLNNDMDYAIVDDLYSRNVTLFDSSTVPVGSNLVGKNDLTLGAGRVNDTAMPDGDTDNSGLIESLRNVFNYRKYAKPTTVQDVVWPMHNAKHTDDLGFDDYLDNDALIVSNMTGLVAFDTVGNLRYHSGWTTNSFTIQVKLQNAATSLSDRLVIPRFGAVTGKGRLEPAASGGVHGKGFWMDGTVGVQYTIAAQPAPSVSTRDWYVGLFVDCRFANNNTSRLLVTFPDGTNIRLNNHNKIEYWAASAANPTSTVTINAGAGIFANLVPDPGWAHFAWQIKKGGKEIDFLLNGMLYNRTTLSTSFFQMVPGTLIVGHNTATSSLNGFKGWIDDFKVLAHTVDPETACNHAGGTLVGLLSGYTGYLRDFNNSFPNNNSLAIADLKTRLEHSGERTYGAYANHYNYGADNGTHLGNIPTNADSLRQAIHFPEGPLFSNRPRPESSKNNFCITCHSTSGQQGLDLMALSINQSLTAPNDPRRMPSQPLRHLFGNIPAGLVDAVFPGLPSSPVAPTNGILVDTYLQTTIARATVKTFSLLNASTGEELQSFVLVNGTNTVSGTLTLSNYPVTTQFAIRANLDFAQGSVNFVYDGGASVSRNMQSTLPYAIGINRPSISTTAHTINATPSDSGSVTKILSLTVN